MNSSKDHFSVNFFFISWMVLAMLVTWIHLPSFEEKQLWIPKNTVIKNPFDGKTYKPISEFRIAESVIMIPLEQYKDNFLNKHHEIYIQQDSTIFYVTEKDGLKFSAKQRNESRPHIHKTPLISWVDQSGVAKLYYPFDWASWFIFAILLCGFISFLFTLAMFEENANQNRS